MVDPSLAGKGRGYLGKGQESGLAGQVSKLVNLSPDLVVVDSS